MAYHEGVRLAEPPATGTAEPADDLLERQRHRESSAHAHPRRLPIIHRGELDGWQPGAHAGTFGVALRGIRSDGR